MSRIISTESTGKQRTQLTRAIAFALRQLARETEFGDEARDLAAFIAIALKTIAEGIESSVAAWEKRGYWVKADRFRLEWAWTEKVSAGLAQAVKEGDWSTIAALAGKTAEKLSGVRVGERSRLGSAWRGAYKHLLNE
jgi:hypothetical protein